MCIIDSHHFLHNILILLKGLSVQPTAIMSCVVQTVATPVPAASMPAVSRYALRDVSVMRDFSEVEKGVSLWKPVAANMMGSTMM